MAYESSMTASHVYLFCVHGKESYVLTNLGQAEQRGLQVPGIIRLTHASKKPFGSVDLLVTVMFLQLSGMLHVALISQLLQGLVQAAIGHVSEVVFALPAHEFMRMSLDVLRDCEDHR
jgi:hypothetical protein